MFLLTFVIAPVVGLISEFGLGIDPWPVGVVVFGLGFGGLLRIAYALMFESKQAAPPGSEAGWPKPVMAGTPPQNRSDHELGPSSFPAPPFESRWRETRDLEPTSVTDSTTKLLRKDRDAAD